MRPALVAFALVIAALILALAAAIQAAIIYVSRHRAHIYASRTGVDLEPLHRTIEERGRLLAAVEVARVAAGVSATVLLLYLALQRTGLHAGTVALVGLIAGAGLMLIQAIPRTLVRHNPEHLGFRLAPLALAYVFVFGWLGWLFELPGKWLVHLLRLPAPTVEEEEQEEILRLVELEESTGGIEEEERQMIRGIIGLEDTTAREVMVPRLDIAAVSADQSLDDAIQVIVSRGFSRIPVFEGSIDNIAGMIYAKDVLGHLAAGQPPGRLSALARPAYFIPETKKVDELLKELRQHRVHIAIVVDEYGGTAGLVTIEDLLEEIVGEIEDEYDRGEVKIERLSDDEALVDGGASIDVLEELFGIDVEDEDVDTVGGFVYNHLGKIPVPGDEVTASGLTITVLSVTGHRIKKLRIARATQHASPTGSAGN